MKDGMKGKICIVTEFFVPHYFGGGEIRYYNIAKRLMKKGYSVDVISMRIKGAPSYEKIDGINVYHIGPVIEKPPKRSFTDFIKFIFYVYKWLATHDYDVVDAHTYIPLIPLFLSYIFGKQKNIIATIHDTTVHSTDKKKLFGYEKKQWIYFPFLSFILEKFIYKLPYKKIVTVSNEVKKALIEKYGVNPKRIFVVHNGVDSSLKSIGGKLERYKIIFVGRLIPHKHVDELLEAIRRVKKEIPDIKLVIIGDGPMKSRLISLAEEFGLKRNVFFKGTMKNYKDVLREIKTSELLVLPSTREGFGLVLAEANLMGRPVIAYDIGGVKDIVKDGYNGILIRPHDISLLAEKIIYLLKNREIALKMGSKGKEYILKKFTWDRTVNNLEKIYFK